MRRVTGMGGLFFRSRQPEALCEWYEKHLGIQSRPGEGATFQWRDLDNPEKTGDTVWAIFPDATTYFGPSRPAFMMNFRVEKLDRLLDLLRAEGVQVDPKVEEYEYGRFAWITDPEGNRVELWEPPDVTKE